MERLHENQVGEVLPYQYEPEVGEKAASMTDQSDSDQESDSASSDDDQIDHEFETANAWRLETLSWCKCGNCQHRPLNVFVVTKERWSTMCTIASQSSRSFGRKVYYKTSRL